MPTTLRDSGIERLGSLSWGAHVCQFYRNQDDLLELLVPYFCAGLAANEQCMWVTSAPVSLDQAASAMRRAVPDFDDRMQRGQFEILPHEEWYLKDGRFELERVLAGWDDRATQARDRGYEGLRVTGNTAWLEQSHWDDFAQYEAAINGGIGRLKMMAVCTYALDRCRASEVIEVVGTHQFTFVKRDGQWEAVENSERKRMAEALRDREHRLRLLFEHMASGCAYHEIVFDRDRPVDCVLVEANPAFEQQTGKNRDALLGRRIMEALPETERDFDLVSTYERVASSGQPARFERRSGPARRWYSVSAYSPAPGSFVTLFDDINDRRAAEEQREDLIRHVTHDLRMPLSVISLSAQALLAGQQAAHHRLESIVHSCRSMQTMLNDLSDMARLDAAPIRLERRAVELPTLISELIRSMSGAVDTTRIEVVMPAQLPAAYADPPRLERVIVNLLTNALKYSPADSPVRIEGEAREDQIAISIIDRGAGIDPADVPRIFERFFRSKQARRVDGLGLGLYIARSLVEAHSGRIEVETELGHGTRFCVVIPKATADSG